jgi:nucleotide-binding universal stress UspA family protein
LRCAIYGDVPLVDAAPAVPPSAAMKSKRSSYAAGHKRKYLVVIDDTEECDRAVYWAAKRAGRTKSAIVMLRVIEPGDRNQQWLGVADLMKAEAEETTNRLLNKYAARIKEIAKVTAERVVREGSPPEEIVNLIDADADIGILVLAAGTGNDGPGPLVAGLAKTAATFPIPVAIVPGQLADDDLDMMA